MAKVIYTSLFLITISTALTCRGAYAMIVHCFPVGIKSLSYQVPDCVHIKPADCGSSINIYNSCEEDLILGEYIVPGSPRSPFGGNFGVHVELFLDERGTVKARDGCMNSCFEPLLNKTLEIKGSVGTESVSLKYEKIGALWLKIYDFFHNLKDLVVSVFNGPSNSDLRGRGVMY